MTVISHLVSDDNTELNSTNPALLLKCQSPKMAEHHEPHSTLEVLPADHAARAPEVVADDAATAPERDFSQFNDSPELDKKSWPLRSVRTRPIASTLRTPADEIRRMD